MNAPFCLSFMRFRLLLLVLFLFSSVVGSQFVGKAQSTCATRTSFTGWEKCKIVQYCYDSNITQEQRTQIGRAIATWNSANQMNNSKVKFAAAATTFTCILLFKNDNTTTNAGPALTEPSGSGGVIHSATITFYPNGVDANGTPYYASGQSGYNNVWEKAALHEVGHTMGLNHLTGYARACDEPDQVSVMNGLCQTNDSAANMRTTVASCDQNIINSEGYSTEGCVLCSGPTCLPDDLNGGYATCDDAGCPDGGGGGGGCALIDQDGDGWDLCIDCDDTSYDPSNECATECPCIRDTDCDLCNEGYCEISLHECFAYTPILIDIDGDRYRMTDAANGVAFDFRGNGAIDQLSWTAAGSDDAWLTLDRNGNGVIDNGTELFGSATPQAHISPFRNGFIALSHYDRPLNVGNRDGLIDSRDAIFSSLRLWQDLNHNGISEPSELHTLPELGVFAISLAYRESRRTDENGNRFRYRAKVYDSGGSHVGRWAWDVILLRAH